MKRNYYGKRNTKNKLRILSNLHNIIEDYLNGKLSLEKVCVKYEVSRIGLTFILKNNGIKIRDRETTRANLRKLGLYKKLDIEGEKNPNFKNGLYCNQNKKRVPQYYTYKYRIWKNTLLKRDKGCRECGSTEKLNAHHIIPTRENSKKFYDIDNGIILCEKCHSKTFFREEKYFNKYLSLIQNTAKAGV